MKVRVTATPMLKGVAIEDCETAFTVDDEGDLRFFYGLVVDQAILKTREQGINASSKDYSIELKFTT